MFANKIIVSQQNNIYFIDHDKILFCQSDDCYTFIYETGGKKTITAKSLSKFSKEHLKSPDFIRVSQSYVLNRNHIISIDKKHRNVILFNEHVIPFTIPIKDLLFLIVKKDEPNGLPVDCRE